MVSADRAEKLENVVANFGGIMMAGMGMAMGELMGKVFGPLQQLFDRPPEDANGQPIEDLSAHIQSSVSAEAGHRAPPGPKPCP